MRKGIPALLLTLSLLLCGCRLLPERIPPAGLTVHFIDVGQADCALLESGGEYMLIDGGNREDGQLVVSYLEQQGVEELAAVVCTHAVYAPTRTYASKVFDDFVYYADQQRLDITIPSPGDGWTLGETSVTVLGPVQSYADPNDTSIILRVEYGGTSFLFTGDMETSAENDMLDYWGSRVSWETDVLKVGHHGSDTSTGYRFLNEVSPDYAVISVGKGNAYGHPHEEPLSRLKQAGVTILRTDELGTIVARTDGKEVTFTWDNQSANPENAEPAQPVQFIGNVNSHKFHAPDCANLPTEKNRIIFGTYEEAINAGYTPCGSCLG